MKKGLVLLIFIFCFLRLFSQEHKIIYGDKNYMVSDTRFINKWDLKDTLSDGTWIVYFDSSYTQKAIQCTYKNHLKDGKYLEWKKDGAINWDRDYKSGKINGVEILYFYAENIQYITVSLVQNGIQQKTLCFESPINK